MSSARGLTWLANGTYPTVYITNAIEIYQKERFRFNELSAA
jgi:hypothetical protein